MYNHGVMFSFFLLLCPFPAVFYFVHLDTSHYDLCQSYLSLLVFALAKVVEEEISFFRSCGDIS